MSFGILGAACWLGMIILGIIARALRKPGVSWFAAGLNFGGGLTESGIRAMNWAWVCLAGFFVCWVLSVVIGIVTGAFDLVHR